jgi:hypothetical protein
VSAVAAIGAAALLLAPGTASARGERISTRVTSVVSDGSRFVFYKSSEIAITIRDDLRRTTRRVAFPRECRPLSARAGTALLECVRGPLHEPWLLDGRSRTARAVQSPGGAADQYSEIGRYWLAGSRCDPGCSSVYLNWHTSEYRNDAPSRPIRDLDSRRLGPRGRGSSDWLELGRARGRAPLILVHRGRRREVSRCTRPCLSSSVGGGVVTWAEGGNVRAYVVETRRETRLRAKPSAVRHPRLVTVAHTRHWVYAAIGSDADLSRPAALYRWTY